MSSNEFGEEKKTVEHINNLGNARHKTVRLLINLTSASNENSTTLDSQSEILHRMNLTLSATELRIFNDIVVVHVSLEKQKIKYSLRKYEEKFTRTKNEMDVGCGIWARW